MLHFLCLNAAYFAFYSYLCVMEELKNSVLVQGATLADIEEMVNRAIDKRMSAFYDTIRSKPPVMVRRKDAAKLIGVSLPTLDAYAKARILHPKHVGGRIFYSEDELSALRGRTVSSTAPK